MSRPEILPDWENAVIKLIKTRKTGSIQIITVAGNLIRDKAVSRANKTIAPCGVQSVKLT